MMVAVIRPKRRWWDRKEATKINGTVSSKIGTITEISGSARHIQARSKITGDIKRRAVIMSSRTLLFNQAGLILPIPAKKKKTPKKKSAEKIRPKTNSPKSFDPETFIIRTHW